MILVKLAAALGMPTAQQTKTPTLQQGQKMEAPAPNGFGMIYAEAQTVDNHHLQTSSKTPVRTEGVLET